LEFLVIGPSAAAASASAAVTASAAGTTKQPTYLF
jgi:hypothetical protein